MSPTTIGADANAPNELVPVNAKRHSSFSFATVCESIAVLVVARVFERSWLWAGHGPRCPLGRRLPDGIRGERRSGERERRE